MEEVWSRGCSWQPGVARRRGRPDGGLWCLGRRPGSALRGSFALRQLTACAARRRDRPVGGRGPVPLEADEASAARGRSGARCSGGSRGHCRCMRCSWRTPGRAAAAGSRDAHRRRGRPVGGLRRLAACSWRSSRRRRACAAVAGGCAASTAGSSWWRPGAPLRGVAASAARDGPMLRTRIVFVRRPARAMLAGQLQRLRSRCSRCACAANPRWVVAVARRGPSGTARACGGQQRL